MSKYRKLYFALLAGTILSTPAEAATLIPVLDSGMFEYTEGTADDYSFTVEEADSEGNLTEKYYKIVLKPENFSSSESIIWSTEEQTTGDKTGSVEIKLPNGQNQTLYYAYTKPEGYEVQEGSFSLDDVDKLVFLDRSSVAWGGVINNSAKDSSNIDIVADFIGNNVKHNDNYGNEYYAYGGAIYNQFYHDEAALLGNITGNFVGNSATALNYSASGGAIANTGSIESITGDFVGNYTTSVKGSVVGGAIYNYAANTDVSVKIGDVSGDFIGNYANSTGSAASGGAIYNSASIVGSNVALGNVVGSFVGNYATTSVSASVAGGAIYNNASNGTATAENITGNFIGNYVSGASSAYGGAVYNYAYGADAKATAGIVTGDFIGNHAESSASFVNGGAFYNAASSGTTITGDIIGDFIGNYAAGANYTYGGAVYNGASTGTAKIGNITGDFIGNHATDSGYAYGGAIYNRTYNPGADATIGNITGDFIGNYVTSENSSASGGAIFNNHVIGEITGDFFGNYASGSSAQGGALVNYVYDFDDTATIANITGSFIDNHALATADTSLALGGAVYMRRDLTFKTGGENKFFSGNYTEDKIRGKNYNAVFVASDVEDSAAAVTFDTSGGGAWIINDSIEGGQVSDDNTITYENYSYDLAFVGDDSLKDGRTTQYISLNNDIVNAGKVSVEGTTLHMGTYRHEDEKEASKGQFVAALNKDGSVNTEAAAVTSLSLTNAALDLYNGYMETVNLSGWSANNGYLHIDVDPNPANPTADVLNINGNVEGTTQLIVYAHSDNDIRGKSIVFATSTNDTTGKTDSFTVYRVYNSPYMYEVGMTGEGTTEHEWYLTMNADQKNKYAGFLPDPIREPAVPDPNYPDVSLPVYGEVVAYGALPAAALEQTRNMVDNIGNQIKNGRVYTRSCSFVDGYWDGESYYNLWVNPTYYTSNIDSPFAIDADIWGIEAGGDIQRDIHNRLGIFVSYRQGEYDMNGNGDKYRSPVGSEIDIDSYIAGLYYRYDNNNWYAFATLYAGIQEADIKTDDGMKSDTDGVEFGASAEVGYDYALTDSVTLTPELGVFYTQVNYDDAEDNMGKSASYDDARQIELEAGVKLAKTFMTDESFANVYVKPSVVQTIVDGDEVSITGLGDVEALDDATLGRIEIGGRYGFTTNLSAYGWANYTFGSDYDAATFGLGLNYAF